jgi:hypothetical protein
MEWKGKETERKREREREAGGLKILLEGRPRLTAHGLVNAKSPLDVIR